MQYQRDIRNTADFLQPGKINFRTAGIQAVSGTDSHRQAVDAGQLCKTARFIRGGQKGTFRIHIHIILNAAETAEFRFHTAILTVTEIHHGFDQRDILLKRKMTAVDHGTAHALADFGADIVKSFVVVKMQRDRHGKRAGIGVTQCINFREADVFKGARRARQNHRCTQFRTGFQNGLNSFGVMDIKRRNRIAIGLCMCEQIFG